MIDLTEIEEQKAEQLIRALTNRINTYSKETKVWDKAFQIFFRDIGIGYWIKISLNGLVEKVEKAIKKEESTVTISLTTEMLQKIFDGTVSPVIAVMKGQIQINGEAETLVKLMPAFT